ncbi:hypothetical protein CFN16_19860 [Pseudomonas fluorescens]|uniref:Lipoprotein n=1 Tax=Pseudomonas fluorescens TaxID=294 RepID=A0A345V0Q1_PSEFL|nr:hypothetical protein [Pseudomonas fluorescens]AXJ06303.1 hypothetical protein CFN16_19860 [Pseudomonas fluorescens]
MKQCIVVLMFLLCCSCAKRPVLPVIDLDYISVSGRDDRSTLNIKFASKTDVLNFFQNATGESQLGEALYCSLDRRVEFEDFDRLTQYLVGNLVEVESSEHGMAHVYVSKLSALKKEDEGVSNVFMLPGELLTALNERDTVSCRVFTSAYSSGGHYSKPMLIPANDLVRAIQ